MKNKIRIKSVLTLIAVVLTAAVLSAVAATAAYDPSADAVVMVSGLLKYTEETIKPAINTAIAEQIKPVQDSLSSVKDKLTAAEAKLAENEAKLAELEEKLAQSTPAAPAVTSSWEVIYLTTGQTLLATAPCAIILRAGAAAVVSPFISRFPVTNIVPAPKKPIPFITWAPKRAISVFALFFAIHTVSII